MGWSVGEGAGKLKCLKNKIMGTYILSCEDFEGSEKRCGKVIGQCGKVKFFWFWGFTKLLG